jgi:hypothetical protein
MSPDLELDWLSAPTAKLRAALQARPRAVATGPGDVAGAGIAWDKAMIERGERAYGIGYDPRATTEARIARLMVCEERSRKAKVAQDEAFEALCTAVALDEAELGITPSDSDSFAVRTARVLFVDGKGKQTRVGSLLRIEAT